jgi:hypothetical protein
MVVPFLILLGSALLGTWVFTEELRDAQDLTWVRCEVVDATAQPDTRYPSVTVQTSDCGKILYLVGTRRENVEGLAATFEPGPYEFKLGALSQRRIEGDTFLDLAPVAKDIRRLPTESHT